MILLLIVRHACRCSLRKMCREEFALLWPRGYPTEARKAEEESKDERQASNAQVLCPHLTHFSEISGQEIDPLDIVQVTGVSGSAGTTIRWLKPPSPPQIASGELRVEYQQVSFGGPIETEVVTGEVNLVIENMS